MGSKRYTRLAASILAFPGILLGGCYHTPVDTTEFGNGPAPLRMPSPVKVGAASCSYEDSLTGGQVFAMYCNYCHNSPNLSERNFANFRNVAAHMRVRANLTGKEYAKLMEFLRRWNDVPPPNPPPPPAPTRLIFSQPISELRKETPKAAEPPAKAGAGEVRPEGPPPVTANVP
jgi:hypothetical protein